MNLTNVSVDSDSAAFQIFTGWGNNYEMTFLGASFPTQMSRGASVRHVNERIPQGKHAMVFSFEYVKGEKHDSRRVYENAIVLIWREGETLFCKLPEAMKAPELALFERFSVTGSSVTVIDETKKIRYSSNGNVRIEDDWALKTVSVDKLLEHISKQISLEQLDEAATLAKTAVDERVALRAENSTLKTNAATAAIVHGALVQQHMKEQSAFFSLAVWTQKLMSNWTVSVIADYLGVGKALRSVLSYLPSGARATGVKSIDGAVAAMTYGYTEIEESVGAMTGSLFNAMK